jgi:repressor LexA
MGDKASPLGGEVSRGWNSPLRLRLNALKMSAVDLTNRLVTEGGVKKSAEQVRRYITGVSVPHNEIKEQISAIVGLPVLRLWPNAEGYAAPEALGATIPLFGAAEAGFGMDISVMSEPIDQIPALGSLGEDTYAVVVRGESMEPRLEAGDYVYCDPSATFKRGHTVVVQFTDSNGTLRGVVKEFVKRTVGKDRDGHKAWGVTVRQHNPDETYEIQNVQSVSRVVHVKYQ